MEIRNSHSIWASIGAQSDAVQAAKSPCFPVPYTLVMVDKPVAGGKRGIIPCVELKNLTGGYEFRRCDDILQPIGGEPIDVYLKRLEAELCRKDVLGETIL